MYFLLPKLLFTINIYSFVIDLKYIQHLQRNNFSLKTTYSKMNEVSTFDKIPITKRSLVLCDLDDTLLDYGVIVEKYWKEKIVDPDYMIWGNMIRNVIPLLTDTGFYNFLERVKESESEIHFVTHRNISLEEITKEHLNYHGLSHIRTHHLTGCSKGIYSVNNFDVNNRDVIIIDDSKSVHEDIINHIPHVTRYLFKKKK